MPESACGARLFDGPWKPLVLLGFRHPLSGACHSRNPLPCNEKRGLSSHGLTRPVGFGIPLRIKQGQ